MTDYCNGLKSDGTSCRRPAGWGTDHAGRGKCKLHGGASAKGLESATFKHGRYSKYASKSMQEKIDELDNHDILNLVDELQAQRALIAEYITRYQQSGNMSEMSISTVISWFNSVGIMVERISKMQNETALTAAELALLKIRTADLVVKYIDSPEKQRAFVAELFQISEPAKLK